LSDFEKLKEGRPGLRKAAVYIKEQLEMLKERAESNIRFAGMGFLERI
jgi:hypothetical protein